LLNSLRAQELVLQLDAMAYGGDALGRVEGKAILCAVESRVSGSVPRS
jgi:hypothetical protein